MYCFVSLFLRVSSSAVDCLERLVSDTPCCVSCRTLNPTCSLTHSCHSDPVNQTCFNSSVLYVSLHSVCTTIVWESVCEVLVAVIFRPICHSLRVSTDLLTWRISGNFVDGQWKMVCIVQVVWPLFIFFFKKWKYTFSACYNKMVMEMSRCRGGNV